MDSGTNQAQVFGRRQVRPLPRLIGIVGGSGAGKTWLAQHLGRALPGLVSHLSLDDFYRDRSRVLPSKRASLNFDHPRAIDWPSVETALRSCRAGRKTLVPQYDFATHTRCAAPRPFKPAALVLCEGLWLFRRPSLRRLFALKLFLRSPLGLCKERRLERDCRERGRTEEEVAAQFESTVAPMHENFVAPQERWADVVLTEPPTARTVQELATRLQQLLKPRTIAP